MVTTYLPVVTNNLPPIIRSHHLWAGIWGVSILILARPIFNNRILLYVLIYYLLLVLVMMNSVWSNMDKWNRAQGINELYMLTMALTDRKSVV